MSYDVTITRSARVAQKIAPGFGILTGTANITDYNSGTTSEIKGITYYFKNKAPIVICENISDEGYEVEWDSSAKAFKAYRTGTFTGTAEVSTLIVEESVTITSGVGTLAELPAYIVCIEATAGTQAIPYQIIPTGETVSTGLAAVNFVTGGIVAVSGEATTMLVTYFPQRKGTMFDVDNMVVDDSLTASSSKVNTTSRAFAVQYIWDDTDSTLLSASGVDQTGGMEPPGEAPSGTGKAVLDINDSGNTSIDTHSTDNGNTLKVTYLKYAGLPSTDLFIDDGDLTLNSEAYGFSEGADGAYHDLVVPGFGTLCSGEEAGDSTSATWTGPSGTAGAAEATWTPLTNAILTNNGTAFTILTQSFFRVPPGGEAGTPVGTLTAGATEATAVTDIGLVNFIAFGPLT